MEMPISGSKELGSLLVPVPKKKELMVGMRPKSGIKVRTGALENRQYVVKQQTPEIDPTQSTPTSITISVPDMSVATPGEKDAEMMEESFDESMVEEPALKTVQPKGGELKRSHSSEAISTITKPEVPRRTGLNERISAPSRETRKQAAKVVSSAEFTKTMESLRPEQEDLTELRHTLKVLAARQGMILEDLAGHTRGINVVEGMLHTEKESNMRVMMSQNHALREFNEKIDQVIQVVTAMGDRVDTLTDRVEAHHAEINSILRYLGVTEDEEPEPTPPPKSSSMTFMGPPSSPSPEAISYTQSMSPKVAAQSKELVIQPDYNSIGRSSAQTRQAAKPIVQMSITSLDDFVKKMRDLGIQVDGKNFEGKTLDVLDALYKRKRSQN